MSWEPHTVNEKHLTHPSPTASNGVASPCRSSSDDSRWIVDMIHMRMKELRPSTAELNQMYNDPWPQVPKNEDSKTDIILAFDFDERKGDSNSNEIADPEVQGLYLGSDRVDREEAAEPASCKDLPKIMVHKILGRERNGMTRTMRRLFART